jgi:hypothetical protein
MVVNEFFLPKVRLVIRVEAELVAEDAFGFTERDARQSPILVNREIQETCRRIQPANEG